MSYISLDKFGRGELFYNVSGKDKLQVKNIDKVNELSKQLEEPSAEQTVRFANTISRMIFTEKNFHDFQEEIKLAESKELREANHSLYESVQSSSEAFYMSLNNLQ